MVSMNRMVSIAQGALFLTEAMTVGANVARAAARADSYAAAESNTKATVKLSATAKWHEQQNIRTLSKSLTRQRDKES